MAFNIQTFSAEIAKRGVMRNNKFDVLFPIPPGMKSSQVSNLSEFQSVNRSLNLYCEECNLPGAAMMASEIRRYGYGVSEKRPFAPAFTDVQMVLRCDAQGLIHGYFHNWQRIAVCYEAGEQGTLMSGHPIGPTNEQYLWELSYKTDFAVPVKITAYDDAGGTPIIITLTQAFPIFVGDIQLNWSSRGEYARLPVSLSFFDWSAHAHLSTGKGNSTTTQNSPPVVIST